MCKDFYHYDLLTQLTFLETLENNINDEEILLLLNPNQNFFNDNIMTLEAQSMRKLLLTFSKFYARDLLSNQVLPMFISKKMIILKFYTYP